MPLRDMLGDVRIPTLVLCGDADERSPRSVASALHTALPMSTLVVIPDAGHEMFLETPEAADAVRAFLRSVTT